LVGDRLDWRQGMVPGLKVTSLHQGLTKHTALVRWAPDTRFNPHTHVGGEEIFVLAGVFRDEHGAYPAGTWIRSPHMSHHRPFTESEGATILPAGAGVVGRRSLPSVRQVLLYVAIFKKSTYPSPEMCNVRPGTKLPYSMKNKY
jgi:hypothetical protein